MWGVGMETPSHPAPPAAWVQRCGSEPPSFPLAANTGCQLPRWVALVSRPPP